MNPLPPRRPNPGASPPRMPPERHADLPLFISRGQPQEVARVASDANSARWCGIAGTDNQQAVDDENRGARCRPVCALQA
jgi:hypothetical protein